MGFSGGKGTIAIANGSTEGRSFTLTLPELTVEASGVAADLGPLTLGRVWFSRQDGETAVLIAERRGAAWQRRLEWADKP
ncbi:hypothetical protein VZ95_13855 [Elstera litoralis]|uniref:Uncharacterized protein n=1 Tax=Elstera litoralis TaxID=552518 RepID=A0A0F3IR18_9PROT|nr:hypothetical protein [Elstera litoralis]KJV09052.1 hypothetical protein VZ95_13855 [Elstera litoralis]